MNIIKLIKVKQEFEKRIIALYIGFAFLCLFSFIEISQEVMEGGFLKSVDNSVLNWIVSIRSPILNQIMLFFTSLGNTEIVVMSLLIFVLYFLYTKRKQQAYAIIISTIISVAFIAIMKFAFHRSRPPLVEALINESSFSFPSSHAMISISFYGLIGYIFLRFARSNVIKIVIFLFTVIIVLGIGISRVYLGAHWLSDVVASYSLGGAWLAFLIIAFHEKKLILNIENEITHLGIGAE